MALSYRERPEDPPALELLDVLGGPLRRVPAPYQDACLDWTGLLA
ncbi:hypothetical protein [Streptomyces sp. NRRL WC-3549]|nr:hypothetical protein [Streptomyces sp. NRRL WC-3549]